MSTIEERVKNLVSEQLNVTVDDVTNQKSFVDDLGASDQDVIEIHMALEEEFEMNLPDEEAEKITTVQSAIDYVNSHKA
ncbi:acyl carrier protein [Streptomyces sp. NBC_00237]|uniref:acyl carrier protein n=1 Tax=Streptomyces sp. NBC_00237 TaxID=2975687 RepID=UPI00225578F9|nr:acyl carrier protein [Streptomyces sp. NBC_00237]MCX5200614.1 acyl carrier protein [Streptomyces sp. NBC_00237]